ncbi:MAG: GNAT family N-acetyltransferase [Ferruginibacter sp.]|nr:GNAT family N-acetyltransferase [Chitinophagaceae bacterium]
MTSIVKAGVKDAQLLSEIANLSFIESHGHSAAAEVINSFLTENYNYNALKEELEDEKNIFHILYYDGQPAGYSKIIFNAPWPGSPVKNSTKLERIYLLKKFYNLKLGLDLFQFNLELSKNNDQTGMWLNVWIENHRAIDFYKKNGFVVIGSYDFHLSETHSNPNHQLFLQF